MLLLSSSKFLRLGVFQKYISGLVVIGSLGIVEFGTVEIGIVCIVIVSCWFLEDGYILVY